MLGRIKWRDARSALCAVSDSNSTNGSCSFDCFVDNEKTVLWAARAFRGAAGSATPVLL